MTISKKEKEGKTQDSEKVRLMGEIEGLKFQNTHLVQEYDKKLGELEGEIKEF